MTKHYPVNNYVKAEFLFSDGSRDEINLGDIIQAGDIMITSKILDSDIEFPNFSVSKGDKRQVIFSLGTWVIHYKYFSDSELIGEHLQLITPLDFVFKGRVRAFDVGMSIYKNATGNIHRDIGDSSINMLENGMISEKLDQQLADIIDIALTSLENEEDQIIIKFE